MPPATAPAPASAGVVGPPAMGAAMIGMLMPNASRTVLTRPSSRANWPENAVWLAPFGCQPHERTTVLRLLGPAEVGLDLFDVLELGLGVLGRDGRRDDDATAGGPVDGSGDRVLVGHLQGVDDAHDLVEVAADRLRVGQCQADLV